MFQQSFYNNSEPKNITKKSCLPRVASRRLAASCLPFVEIMLILAESAEGGKEMVKNETAHVGRITKIVDCFRIVFGLPYNYMYKQNLSLKMI